MQDPYRKGFWSKVGDVLGILIYGWFYFLAHGGLLFIILITLVSEVATVMFKTNKTNNPTAVERHKQVDAKVDKPKKSKWWSIK